jgi:hypothetical protein
MMRPDERKRLLRVLCEFANRVEKLAGEQSDVPLFIVYIERQLERLLERAIEERINRVL